MLWGKEKKNKTVVRFSAVLLYSDMVQSTSLCRCIAFELRIFLPAYGMVLCSWRRIGNHKPAAMMRRELESTHKHFMRWRRAAHADSALARILGAGLVNDKARAKGFLIKSGAHPTHLNRSTSAMNTGWVGKSLK